jgi:diguanylate cyclase (GGDEF)-like protein
VLTLEAAPAGESDTARADRLRNGQMLGETVRLALANMRLRGALAEQALRDALTGLFNRRYLDETLPREVARARRDGRPLAVAMVDLDHFKSINDRHGHDGGDLVLRAVADCLRDHTRAGDIVCRYGGEELTLVLPDTPADSAVGKLDELRAEIGRLRVSTAGASVEGITVSAGVAVLRAGDDANALLAAADAALYRAKREGRNRVVRAGAPAEASADLLAALP